MKINNENLHDISLIYRFVYKHSTGGGQELHRNSIKKAIYNSKKIPTKTRFNSAFEGLVSLGLLNVDHDNVSVNPEHITVGILQKGTNDYYIVSPKTQKRIAVDKRDASGYTPGDSVNISINYINGKPTAIILGRNNDISSVHEIKSDEKPANETIKNAVEKRLKPQPQIDRGNTLLGRVVKISHDNLVFIPNKKNLPIRHIPILNKEEELSSFQDKICVIQLTNENAPGLGGEIIAVKGDAGNPIHEFDAIAENYGAIMSWNTPELQAEIKKIPTKVDVGSLNLITEKEAQISPAGKTVDLRHLPFSTIDPASCKDMDDAICSTIDENGNYVCYTAVANVTKYVSLDSAIGENYVNGAFTTYAPNRAYGILPNELSTGICSLNPNEDRLAVVVKTIINKSTGEPISSTIYDALIKSHKKYSYEQAQEITDNLSDIVTPQYLKEKIEDEEELNLDENIVLNYYVADAIKKGFSRRNMVRFDSNKERDIKFDADMNDVVDITPTAHLAYHQVIEAFMITANEAVAQYLKDNKLQGVYRVHDEPSQKKINQANEFFGLMGFENIDSLSVTAINDLVSLVHGTDNEEIVNNFLIKMQSRAKYRDCPYDKEDEMYTEQGEERISHFALQSKRYSHFTSIIRRGPDYPTHYNILAHIHGTKPLDREFIDTIIERANQRQIDIDQAEKDFADCTSAIYAEKHIGETFHGLISKFRYTAEDEGYKDNIVVIVKNEDKGISVELPLSKVIGNKAQYCSISKGLSAISDDRGHIVLKLCTPLNFIIEHADRKTMTISGRAEKLLSLPKEKSANYYQNQTGHINNTKKQRAKPYSPNKNKRQKQEYGKKQKSKKHPKDVYERYGFDDFDLEK